MPIAQFAALVQVLPAMEQVLKQKGEQLRRPNYGDLEGGTDGEIDGGKEKGTEKRRNFDETSEED